MVATEKKVASKVSGAKVKDIVETKESASDLYPFMAWLDPYIEARKTKTNFIGAELNESDQELPEGGDIQEEDDNESSGSEISDSRRKVAAKMQCHNGKSTGR